MLPSASRSRSSALVALLAVASTAGCAKIIGLADYSEGDTTSTGSSHTSQASSSTSGSGGTGGATASSSSSGGGSSVSSGGGDAASSSAGTGGSDGCVDGAPCYFGLDGTAGIGSCKTGTTTCQAGVATCDDVRPMVQLCAASSPDDDCEGASVCTGRYRWAEASVPASAAAVAAGLDGTVAFAGTASDGMSFYADAFDARGRRCWALPAVYGGGGAFAVKAVAISGAKRTPDGRVAAARCDGSPSPLAASTVIAGSSTGDIDLGHGPIPNAGGTDAFVTVLDTAGQVAWGTTFGGAGDDSIDAVAIGPAAEIYLAGRVSTGLTGISCPTPGAGPGAFVAKLGADGACAWMEVFNGPGFATGLAVDASGRVVVSGRLTGSVDFEGTMLDPPSGDAGFVARLTSDGLLEAGPVSLACATDASPLVAVTPASDVLTLCSIEAGSACGGTAGAPSLAVLEHLDATFAVKPATCFMGPSAIHAGGLAVDPAGYALVQLATGGEVTSAGFSQPVTPPGMVVLKLASPFADYVWAYPYGSAGSVTGPSLAVDGTGNVLAAGTSASAYVKGPLQLGAGAFTLELAP